MMVLIALFVIAFVSWCFLSLNEPLFMGFLLVFLAGLVSFMMAISLSVLLAMLMFLTYVGGIMILFLYVLSVCPNQKLVGFMDVLKIFFLIGAACFSLSAVVSSGGFVDIKPESHFHVMCFNGAWELYIFFAVILLYVMMLVCYICVKKRVTLRSL